MPVNPNTCTILPSRPYWACNKLNMVFPPLVFTRVMMCRIKPTMKLKGARVLYAVMGCLLHRRAADDGPCWTATV